MLSFRLPVLGFSDGFLSPFPDSLPQLFLRCLPCAVALGLFPFSPAVFRPLTFRFRLLSLCFFLSVLPVSASQWLLRCPSPLSLPRFPLPFRPVSRASLSVSVLGFSAGFLSSLPVPLPQPLPWCLPSPGSLRPLLFGLFRSPSLPFVRFGSLLTTQLSALSFPFFPGFPWQRFFRYAFPFRFACFHASLPVPGTQPSVLPFSRSRFASQWLSRSRPPAFRFSGFPLAFALGSGYLACPFRTFRFASDLAYITTTATICQQLFFIFFNYFLVFYNHFNPENGFVHMTENSFVPRITSHHFPHHSAAQAEAVLEQLLFGSQNDAGDHGIWGCG